MKNGAMSELHLARFSLVSEFDNYRINCELDGVDVSNMMSRREFVHFLNKSTPEMVQERLDMTMNNINNKEQSSENINNKKSKLNKKRRTNDVDDDVSAADLFPGDGSDYKFKFLDFDDPEVKAQIDENKRKVQLVIKKLEKELEDREKEEKKMMKEEKKKKLMKKKMKEEKEKKKKKKKKTTYKFGGS